MVVLIDVGNTNIVFGIYKDNEIKNIYRIKSFTDRTSDEYYIQIKSLLENGTIDNVIISSVVPVITSALVKLFKTHYKLDAMVVSSSLRTGIMLKGADDPKSVGADLVCDCVGAMNITNEALIVDLGTATKYIYVKNNQLIGVSIAPGVAISMRALVSNAALLPNIELQAPKKILGNNTISCMQSGVIFGAASQVDGMIERIKEELNRPDLFVIATGGLSKLIVPLCKTKITLEENLVLNGLVTIYNKNI